MADSKKEIAYEITADSTQFVSAIKGAGEAAAGMTTQLKSSLGSLGGAFEQISAPLKALAGIVAGGAFFKEMIGTSLALNSEAMKLSKSLGITGTAAATLRTALGDIYSDSDTYVGAFQKFAKQIKTNESGLKDMGLQTRDSNGNLRDSNTLFTEALGVVGQYKPGLDKTTAAMTLFGKGVDDVMALQKLNNHVLKEAAQKNEDLGLTMTKEGVEAGMKYKAAMNDVGDVMEGVKNTIGKAVMPIFAELGHYLGRTGPYVVGVFKGALTVLVGAFRLVQGAALTLSGVVFEAFSTMVDAGGLLGDVFSNLFKGDFSGAVNSAKQLGSRIGQSFKNAFGNFISVGNDVESDVKSDIERIWGKGTEVGAPKNGDKNMPDFDKPGAAGAGAKEKSRMPAFERELEDKRLSLTKQSLLEGNFREMTKAAEAQFWRDKSKLADVSAEDQAKAGKKAAEAELQMLRESFQTKVENLKAEEALYQHNTDKKLALARQVQSLYQEGTKDYEAAQARINAIERQAAEQTKAVQQIKRDAMKDTSLAAIDTLEQQYQFEHDLGLLNDQQMLQAQMQFENSRNEVLRQSLQTRMQDAERDPDRNVAELARLQAESQQLEIQHQARLRQIRRQAVLESQQNVLQFGQSLQGGFAQVFSQIGTSIKSVSGLMRGMFNAVLQSFIQMLAQMAAKWLVNQVIMKGISKVMGISEIATEAGKAGAGGVASMAAAPFPLNLGAPAFGASMSALAMSFAATASASGGFDIPAGLNPVTQLHAREMVLPAQHADVIRSLADSQGGAGGMGGGQVHFHDYGGLSDSDIRRKAGVIADEINKLHRNGWRPAR
jgi:hypothetical protein